METSSEKLITTLKMSLQSLYSSVRKSLINHNTFRKTATTYTQHFFSSKASTETPNEGTEKKKKIPIPRITLISNDDKVTITTLEEAQKLSKRRDLKLVKIIDVDTKSQRPVYKLMTGAEYHAEDLKQREQRKQERLNSDALKGEKVVMLSSGIAEHDLKTQVNKVVKWLGKRYEVRFIINGDADKMDKAVSIFNILYK